MVIRCGCSVMEGECDKPVLKWPNNRRASKMFSWDFSSGGVWVSRKYNILHNSEGYYIFGLATNWNDKTCLQFKTEYGCERNVAHDLPKSLHSLCVLSVHNFTLHQYTASRSKIMLMWTPRVVMYLSTAAAQHVVKDYDVKLTSA